VGILAVSFPAADFESNQIGGASGARTSGRFNAQITLDSEAA
jgi:hypothetical protein